ncbi:MAG: hypothetical protein AAGB30_03370 [Pedobacter sp.]
MLRKRPKTYKVIKWVLGIFLCLAMLLLCASWYVSFKFKPLIRKELQELVKKSTNGLYSISFSEINTNFITGSATIKDVNIVPDTNVYHGLINAQKAPNNLYYIRLAQLSIKRFHPFLLYFKHKAEVNLLLFDKPSVIMVNRHFPFNEHRPPRPRKSPYDYISKLFKSLRIAVVDFREINFKYVDNNGIHPEIDSVANLNVTLKDWLIDAHSTQDTTRFYLLKDIDVNLRNYRYATPDSMYHISLNQLDFNALSGKMKLKQVEVIPRYSEQEFAKVNGYARDRFSILFDQVAINGIDLPQYIQKKTFMAQDVRISDGHIAVYNDNTYPKLSKIKTGRFPHQLLQQLKTRLRLRKIILDQIDISYAEFDRTSKLKGKITFQQTGGVLANVTNMESEKKKDSILWAKLTSKVMGQGKLAIDFRFDLNSPIGAFAYKGTVSKLDGRKLNAIIKPLGMLQVNRGMINQLDFDIKADQDLAKGNLTFRFNDLSVKLLKKQAGKDRLVKKGLLSILANALVIYADNPSKDGKFTRAKIDFRRQPTASFFSYIWKSLYQGIKYSVGVTPQKEAEIRSHIAKFEQMKDDREERRMRREIRRRLRQTD